VLAQGRTTINGPHQGACGRHAVRRGLVPPFFKTGSGSAGRALQPMVWSDDWPVIGAAPGANGPGEPVLVHRSPTSAAPGRSRAADLRRIRRPFPRLAVAVERESAPRLALARRASGLPAPIQRGRARTRNDGSPAVRNLYDAPNFLLQKFSRPAFAATTTLEFSPAAAGETAGLVVYGYHYALIGLRSTATGRRLVLLVNNAANQPGAEEHEDAGVDIAEASITLHLTVDARAVCRFYYSLDHRTFHPIGGSFQAVADRWVGARSVSSPPPRPPPRRAMLTSTASASRRTPARRRLRFPPDPPPPFNTTPMNLRLLSVVSALACVASALHALERPDHTYPVFQFPADQIPRIDGGCLRLGDRPESMSSAPISSRDDRPVGGIAVDAANLVGGELENWDRCVGPFEGVERGRDACERRDDREEAKIHRSGIERRRRSGESAACAGPGFGVTRKQSKSAWPVAAAVAGGGDETEPGRQPAVGNGLKGPADRMERPVVETVIEAAYRPGIDGQVKGD